MKKTLGAISLLALGVCGVVSYVNGATSDATLGIDCGSWNLQVTVADLDFGTSQTSLTEQTDLPGSWGNGITVTDTQGSCGSTGTVWQVSLAFDALSGASQGKVLTPAASNDSVVDGNGNGDVEMKITQAAGNDDTSANLTQVDGSDSDYVTAEAFSSTAFLATQSQAVLTRTYNAADNAIGTWRLVPGVALDIPGWVVPDTYRGTITVSF